MVGENPDKAPGDRSPTPGVRSPTPGDSPVEEILACTLVRPLWDRLLRLEKELWEEEREEGEEVRVARWEESMVLLLWEDTRFERLYLNSAESSSSVLGFCGTGY